MKFGSVCAGLVLAVPLLAALPAMAQDQLPTAVRSNAMVQMFADRGLDCDLLKPWQSAALRGMVAEDMAARPAEQLDLMAAEAERLGAETACDADLLNAWIDGSSRGFETEMLPPYLVAYRQMARMQNPPDVFLEAAANDDLPAAVTAIDAKLEALEAAGVMPEGGQSWPEYFARVEEFIAGFVALQDSGDAESAEVLQASALIRQSVEITELWLMDP